MKDLTIFIFGLVAAIMAIGPLMIALVLDLRTKNKDQK